MKASTLSPIVVILLSTLVAPGLVAAGVNSQTGETGSPVNSVPLELIGNNLYIRVSINHREYLWCLDTGAGISVIDPVLAKSLSLESSGSVDVMGAGASTAAGLGAAFSLVCQPSWPPLSCFSVVCSCTSITEPHWHENSWSR